MKRSRYLLVVLGLVIVLTASREEKNESETQQSLSKGLSKGLSKADKVDLTKKPGKVVPKVSKESKPRKPNPRDFGFANNEITDYIIKVFNPLGREACNWALKTAMCESSMNPKAVNPAGSYGLLQYTKGTWREQCNGDIWDWKAQVRCTRRLYERGHTWRWPNCP